MASGSVLYSAANMPQQAHPLVAKPRWRRDSPIRIESFPAPVRDLWIRLIRRALEQTERRSATRASPRSDLRGEVVMQGRIREL